MMKKNLITLIFLLVTILTSPCSGQEEDAAGTFAITGYRVKGNTIFDGAEMAGITAPYTGPAMTTEQIEQARNAQEKAYHELGYPTVLVNIPEQTVESGTVLLEVVESRIRRVRITGNRYYTMERIRNDLPSLAPGSILYLPRLQEELNRLNRGRDLKVAPVLQPGKNPGTIDVELKVVDRLPLHGSLELSNRASHDTSSLRLNGTLRYENLWQRSHSASLQYQTAPEEPDEVQVFAGSYILPSPWHPDDLLVLYGVASDSDTAFGQGFQVTGKGNMVGVRYVCSLPSYKSYAHNITMGVDYKDFDEELGFETGDEPVFTPVKYAPLSFAYTGSLPDSSGFTQFSAGLNMAFRGLVTDSSEFELKRFGARGNYLYATMGVERHQKLPAGFGLFLKLDGQLASQPLISNEQYSAGGMMSVRGYKESEEMGDNAIHAMAELSAADMTTFFARPWESVSAVPYVFFDYASLAVRSPLPGQEAGLDLSGTGVGLRGRVTDRISYDLCWAVALSTTEQTESGTDRANFVLKYEF
ncbi:MAG: ShlB/FhaC/HecB family hemolysin secretion/activation protein [Deltaproteobacteria bacterium]|nr:ShlB/FhaC/HecB family hemolysin secretion/activation protein [Deltaproteobacteria bacterium]